MAKINLINKINTIYSDYTIKLSFYTKKIKIDMQKIDKSYSNIFKIVITNCLIKNKLESIQFFYKAFLLANISLEVVLKIFSLTFSKRNMLFTKQKLVFRTYIAIETLLIFKRVEIIDKRKYTVMVLNADIEIFGIYITALSKYKTMPIQLFLLNLSYFANKQRN